MRRRNSGVFRPIGMTKLRWRLSTARSVLPVMALGSCIHGTLGERSFPLSSRQGRHGNMDSPKIQYRSKIMNASEGIYYAEYLVVSDYAQLGYGPRHLWLRASAIKLICLEIVCSISNSILPCTTHFTYTKSTLIRWSRSDRFREPRSLFAEPSPDRTCHQTQHHG